MTANEIHDLLETTPTWKDANWHCQDDFVYEMRGMQYGRDALLDAWAWHFTGWHSGHRRALAGVKVDHRKMNKTK